MSQSELIDPEDMTALLEDSAQRVIQQMETNPLVSLDEDVQQNLQEQIVQRNFGLAYHVAKDEGLGEQFITAIQEVAKQAGLKLEPELIEKFCKDN